MADSPAVVELIRELQRERSPLERMRLLARAWRTIRRMTPAERARLAQEAGVDGADRVLSRMGAGVSAAQVLSSLSGSPADDPESLRKLVEQIGSPEGRAEVVRRAVEAVEPQPEPESRPVLEPPRPTKQPPPASPSPPPPPPPAPDPPVPTAEPVMRPAPWLPAAPPPPAPAPAPEPVSDLAAIPSLTRRFRALREEATRRARPRAEALVRAVEAFPDGWARRRAAAHLIREGLVADEAALESIVATMSRDNDRAWCRRLFRRSVA